jgi:hypothetical protein
MHFILCSQAKMGFCLLILQQIVLILNIAACFISFKMDFIKSFPFYFQTVLNVDHSVHCEGEVYSSSLLSANCCSMKQCLNCGDNILRYDMKYFISFIPQGKPHTLQHCVCVCVCPTSE